MRNERVTIARIDDAYWWVSVGASVVLDGLSQVEAEAIKKFADAIQRDFMIIEQAKYHDLEKHFRE